MKTCPHCNQINPRGRNFCINCGRRLEEEKKGARIGDSLLWIVAGIVLILSDTELDFSPFHIIPIPYVLSLIGVFFVIIGLETIIMYISSVRLHQEIDPLKQDCQTITFCSSFLRGVISGLGAGVLSAVFWYAIATLTQYHFGVIAIITGWLIGRCVVMGSGGKKGWVYQSVSVMIDLLVLFFSEYFIIRHFIVQELAQEGYSNIPVFFPLESMLSMIRAALNSEPMSIFLWIISVGLAFAIPGNFWARLFSKDKSNKDELSSM